VCNQTGFWRFYFSPGKPPGDIQRCDYEVDQAWNVKAKICRFIGDGSLRWCYLRCEIKIARDWESEMLSPNRTRTSTYPQNEPKKKPCLLNVQLPSVTVMIVAMDKKILTQSLRLPRKQASNWLAIKCWVFTWLSVGRPKRAGVNPHPGKVGVKTRRTSAQVLADKAEALAKKELKAAAAAAAKEKKIEDDCWDRR